MAETKKKRHILQVEPRTEFGKEATKRLRAAEYVPVVFYSGGEEALSFQMTNADLRTALHSGDRIFNIMIGDEQRRAMVKEVQFHPVTDEIIHVDFLGVRLRDIIEIPVPIIPVGEPLGVQEGGLLQHVIHEVVVRCKGADVPDAIEVDVTALNIGDAIHVEDIRTESYEILWQMTSLWSRLPIRRRWRSKLPLWKRMRIWNSRMKKALKKLKARPRKRPNLKKNPRTSVKQCLQ